MKKIPQLFLFFIPTLMVGLVYVSTSQQNIFATDDDNSYDLNSVKIESQNKHIPNAVILLFYYLINKKFILPLLILSSSIITYIDPLNNINGFPILKGRSPPYKAFSVV